MPVYDRLIRNRIELDWQNVRHLVSLFAHVCTTETSAILVHLDGSKYENDFILMLSVGFFAFVV